MSEVSAAYRTADAEPYDLPLADGWALPREDRMRLTDEQRMYRAVPESDVIRAVLDWFTRKGGLAWRNNTGSFAVEAKGTHARRFVRYGEVGSSDVLGLLAGRFWSIETKTEIGKLTEAQIQWQVMVADHGGVARVCRPSDWENVLERALESSL